MPKKIIYLDKNINRKSNIIRSSLQFFPESKIPMPSLIEISDSGTCNRKCSFCPRSDDGYQDIKEFITTDLHTKLMNELSDLNYKGLIMYSGFNEPLLNKEIYKNIFQARKLVPESKIELITNGDVLNEKRLVKLFESGLSTILISVYDGPDDFDKFKKKIESVGLEKDRYVIRRRYLPPEEDFGITISNRGGQMKDAVHSILPLKEKMSDPCNYPAYSFFLDYNGDVLMCSHDWGKKNILGNLNKNTLKEIWLSEIATLFEKKLISSNRSLSPCNVCDVSGELIGSSHSAAWKNFYHLK